MQCSCLDNVGHCLVEITAKSLMIVVGVSDLAFELNFSLLTHIKLGLLRNFFLSLVAWIRP